MHDVDDRARGTCCSVLFKESSYGFAGRGHIFGFEMTISISRDSTLEYMHCQGRCGTNSSMMRRTLSPVEAVEGGALSLPLSFLFETDLDELIRVSGSY